MSQTTSRDGTRFYTVPDGEGKGGTVDLPSVTTILKVLDKPGLIYWAANSVADYAIENHATVGALLAKDDRDGAYQLLKKSPWSQRDRAAVSGTEVHDIIERLILGQQVDVPVAAQPYIDAWGKFVGDYGNNFEASEMTVYSLTHGYAGTADALLRVGDRLGVCDWKTARGKSYRKRKAYTAELLQVAAYANAEYALLPDGSAERLPTIDGGTVVALCDDGYSATKIESDYHFRGFVAALGYHRWINQ